MYIKRHMEEVVERISKMFGCVLLTGARQVGKTTLLQKVMHDIPYITFDDPTMRESATYEPGTFIKDYPPPILLDEIQYAPNLFSYIKMNVDKSKKKGQFILSGSQQFKLMKNVSESLAGRIAILNLLGLSLREIKGSDFKLPFIPTEEYFTARKKEIKEIEYDEIWNIIRHGTMPEMCAGSLDWQVFYAAYTKTYVERDVKDLTQVGDDLKFIKFMTAMAAMTGNLLNLASVARDVGISQPTADRWLSILVASNIVYLLRPYSNNILKRAIKTPKVYFLDTGLAAYLTRWNTVDVLKNGAMAGAFFETFVVCEIIKSYYNNGILEPPLYFYRDNDQKEIDILIQDADVLHPIEIKKYADPRKEDIANFKVLEKIRGMKIGAGGIVCMYENLITLKENNRVIPLKFL